MLKTIGLCAAKSPSRIRCRKIWVPEYRCCTSRILNSQHPSVHKKEHPGIRDLVRRDVRRKSVYRHMNISRTSTPLSEYNLPGILSHEGNDPYRLLSHRSHHGQPASSHQSLHIHN